MLTPPETKPPSPIPAVPLSRGERDDRDLHTSETATEAAVGERRALGWIALAAALAAAWLVMPVGVGLLLGTLLAFAVQPLFERIGPRLGVPGAALLVVAATLVAIAVTMLAIALLFATEGSSLTNEWIDSLGPGGPGHAVLSAVGGVTSRLGVPADELTARARELAGSLAADAARAAEVILKTAATGALTLLVAMMSMHVILRHWRAVVLGAQEALPLRPDYTAALLAEFRRVGRSTLLGTVGTAFAQGMLAAVGFWISGVPRPLLFGVAAAVASLVPVVGAALVWLPAGIVLILSGHPVRGGIEIGWGALVVGVVADYVIRPRLVGGSSGMPTLVTFTALVGGVELLGLKGLIVGPVLMSLAIAVLRLYATEARKRRRALLGGGPGSASGLALAAGEQGVRRPFLHDEGGQVAAYTGDDDGDVVRTPTTQGEVDQPAAHAVGRPALEHGGPDLVVRDEAGKPIGAENESVALS